jgi:predicted DNA-binding transcriptional regulator YafY
MKNVRLQTGISRRILRISRLRTRPADVSHHYDHPAYRIPDGYRVCEEFEERQITQPADGFIVTMTYPEDEWVYGYLLSFGPSAEVLSPPHVRASIAERLKRMVKIY